MRGSCNFLKHSRYNALLRRAARLKKYIRARRSMIHYEIPDGFTVIKYKCIIPFTRELTAFYHAARRAARGRDILKLKLNGLTYTGDISR